MQRLRRSGHRYREITIRNQPFYVDVTDPSGGMLLLRDPLREGGRRRGDHGAEARDVFLDVGANSGTSRPWRPGSWAHRAGRRVRAARGARTDAEIDGGAQRGEADRRDRAPRGRERGPTFRSIPRRRDWFATLDPEVSPVRAQRRLSPGDGCRRRRRWTRGCRAGRTRRAGALHQDRRRRARNRGCWRAWAHAAAAGVTIVCETTSAPRPM